MNIGITNDIMDSTKYPKGVYRYINNLTTNLGRINSNHNFYSVKEPKALDKDIDLLHITDFRVRWLPTILRGDMKKVLTLHGGRFWVPPMAKPKFYETPKVWALIKFLGLTFPQIKRKIDMFILVSHFLEREVIENLKVPEEKVRVIYLGINEMFKPQKFEKSDHFILSDTPIPELITVFYKLKKRGLNHKLKIFSMREYGYKRAKDMVIDLGLEKCVIFLGYVSDDELVKLYNTADLYLRLPIVETFGIPPLEAMACGCPVLTTNVGSLPEIVGSAGIVEDLNNIGGIVNSILEILSNNGLREDMIAKGIERAKLFSWKDIARETTELYEEVLSK